MASGWPLGSGPVPQNLVGPVKRSEGVVEKLNTLPHWVGTPFHGLLGELPDSNHRQVMPHAAVAVHSTGQAIFVSTSSPDLM